MGYNPMLLYFAAQIVEFWPLGAFSVGPCAPLTYPHQCGMLVVEAVVLPYLLALQDAVGSSHVYFLIPALEAAVSLSLVPRIRAWY